MHLTSVQAAIGRPYSGYHRSIAKKAAVLVEGVAGGHGFTDGNKRTSSIILMDLLTYRSGYRLTLLKTDGNPGEVLENLVIDLVCHRLRLGEKWFRGSKNACADSTLRFDHLGIRHVVAACVPFPEANRSPSRPRAGAVLRTIGEAANYILALPS